MTIAVIRVTNGPDKSDLLRALGQQLHATFDTADGPIEAHVEVLEEHGSGGVGFMNVGSPGIEQFKRCLLHRSVQLPVKTKH